MKTVIDAMGGSSKTHTWWRMYSDSEAGRYFVASYDAWGVSSWAVTDDFGNLVGVKT